MLLYYYHRHYRKGLFTSNQKVLKAQNCSCRIPEDKEIPTTVECCALCIGLDEIPGDIPEISMLGKNEAAEKVIALRIEAD